MGSQDVAMSYHRQHILSPHYRHRDRMSKKSQDLIPLLDYLRIHRVIRSVLDSAGAHTAHACWFFSMAGAAILRHHYHKEAHPLAGAMCLMADEKKSNVLCFASIENDEVQSSETGFHAMVVCDDHVVDFMSPLFPETSKSAKHDFITPAKSFQRRIDTMTTSPADLKKDGDFFFDPNMQLTDHLELKVAQSLFQKDVINACVAWYVRPPKPIPAWVVMGDPKEGGSKVTLKEASVIGAW
ncbi:Protein of uncharacterised function (DUF2026) [Pseudomonas putida]|nr:Protein of unknown function [Pseudomonas putida]SMQ03905.1 Protein of unknown function [Pseudomonas putida]VEE42631.1 Protein of uncharacterised function (DUF2026) [Pseudomonas putida]VTQ27898.1 Protein of uncharacterised function (DUF2026) [Pseudomonas putida]